MLLSRRKFLKITGAAAAVSPFVSMPRIALGATGTEQNVMVSAPPRPFGRAIRGSVVRAEPSLYAKIVKSIGWDQSIALLGQAESDQSPTKYNQTWYRVDGGWVYSAFIQPCENTLNEPITKIDKPFWVEVSVPKGVARGAPNEKAWAAYPVYFGSVFEAQEAVQDADSKAWFYRISDGAQSQLFINAQYLRRIDPSEITPLSPEVPLEAKSILVDTKTRITTAYENGKEVFRAKVATGAEFSKLDGTKEDFRTMKGDFRIYENRFSSRMVGGGERTDPGFYDLPGVSWCSYFTTSRIAFHTAYWHNDFGAERSHGCVNMLPEHALWVYRWTMPVADYEQRFTRTAKYVEGSLVKVI
ncbi:MAG TPA: L,D-transpeptidase family protein [Thermoflexales bacterium]|nr:L,D-transpeptidase family protein [Thermoflexales bacterium]